MRFCFLIMILLLSVSGFSQKSKKLKPPPGTVQINDTLFSDRTEVANIHWREYLYWLSRFDSLKYQSMLPDTLVWGVDTTYYYNSSRQQKTFTSTQNQLQLYYLRHGMFDENPVVGISYEQVISFCHWRTLAANYVVYCKKNKLIPKHDHRDEKFPVLFYYRLPSKEEWEMLAINNVDSNRRSFKKYTKDGNAKFIHNTNEIVKHPFSKNFGHNFKPMLYTSTVLSYFPNNYGLYNLLGNVAEMVAEKGIAKGGSFVHTLEECKISNNQHYTKPERWLGFRCVAVLVK